MQGDQDPSKAGPATPRRRSLVRRLLRWLLLLVLLILVAIAGLLWWASRAGSLPRALDLAARFVPLQVQGAEGAILGQGSIAQLRWEKDGLSVTVEDATLDWHPSALRHKLLQISTLSARSVVIDDQSPKTESQASGPPESLQLPLQIQLDDLHVEQLQWAGPPELSIRDLAGRYHFDGSAHHAEIDHVEFEGGHYQARADLSATDRMQLEAMVSAALVADADALDTPQVLGAQAAASGPLADLQLRARVRQLEQDAARAEDMPELIALADWPQPREASDEADAGSAETSTGPSLDASARLTIWEPQPLPEALARVSALDLSQLWAQAPATRLSGTVQAEPLDGDESHQQWQVKADLHNGLPGPWDQQQLPLDHLQAHVDWTGDGATIHELLAELGGGQLQASGNWTMAAERADEPGDSNADGAAWSDPWALQATLSGINPAELYSELVATPLSGTVQVDGRGQEADFALDISASDALPRPQVSRAGSAGSSLQGQLEALNLQQVQLKGHWAAPLLKLDELLLRTDAAQIAGQGQFDLQTDPQDMAGSTRLSLQAPGLQATVDGSMQADQGQGKATVQIDNAAQLLEWARKLPGADAALASWQADGQASLNLNWKGGWQSPALDALLDVPTLRLNTGDSPDGDIQLQAVHATLQGPPNTLQLQLQGQVQQGAQEFTLETRASASAKAPQALATSDWAIQIPELRLAASSPALGNGKWQLGTQQALQLDWLHAKQALSLKQGALNLQGPDSPHVVQLQWDRLDWQQGALRTQGQLQGFPLEWVQKIAQAAGQDSMVGGDAIFDGNWDVSLGTPLQIRAELQRRSGDIILRTTDPETGVSSNIAAGVRDFQLLAHNEGSQLLGDLNWETEIAGSGSAQVQVQMQQGSGGQWSVPPTAPLQGKLNAELPQIEAWSPLAPPGWRIRGSIAANADLSGTVQAPAVSGIITADDVALRSVVDGLEFSNGRLRAHLQGQQLILDELLLQGAGDLETAGSIRATGQAGMTESGPQAQMRIVLDALNTSALPDRQLVVSGQIDTRFQDDTVHAQGTLNIDRALIVLPDDSRPSLSDDVLVRTADGRVAYGAKAPSRVTIEGAQAAAEQAEAEPSSLLSDIGVDINLGPDFTVRGMGLSTRLEGQLKLQAEGPLNTMPELRGRIQTVDGHFRGYGQNMDITEGTIFFRGPIDNPSLNILALRPIYASDQKAGVRIQGTALLPRINFYSDPVLSDEETMAWVMLGHGTPEDGAEAAILQSAVMAALSGADSGGLGSELGLDELSFNPGSEDAAGGLTLGKRLSDKLYTAYEQSLSGASGTLLIYYELSRRWTARAQANENSALDLLYRIRYD